MKNLKFTPDQIPEIEIGNINSTIRLFDDKDLGVGDFIQFLNSESGEKFGYGLVEQVTQKRLSALVDFEKRFARPCKNNDELLATLHRFYGSDVTLDSVAKVIKFKYLGKKLDNLDVEKTTEYESVKLYTDGGSRGNPGPSACAYVILDTKNDLVKTNGIYLGESTNNKAEYQSVILGLKDSRQIGAKIVHVYMDSLLVVNQINGEFKVKNSDLLPLYKKVKELTAFFEKASFTHIPREMNKLADAKVNEILDTVKS